MKFSYSWLKEYAKDLPSPQELLEKLPLSSVEVEEIEEQGARLENIIVGEVRHIEKHPNADRLAVCTVHTGAAQEQIVCGGSNLFVGMKVAFAKVGSRVEWHGKGEMVEMKPATIRGVKSNGMICTSDEIGLIKLFPKKEENEVIDLTAHSFVSGTPLAEALGLNDTLIDIDNKSMTHRGDLFCHIGMSREMAAVFNVPFNMPQFSEFDTASLPKVDIAVEDATDCPRYMGIEMDVTIADAPEFIKKRLNACGVKSINNVVDITNYVMLELDQPLHAFDVEKVGGKKIIVRRAKKGESMMTLDDVVKELDPSILVIADEQKPMAVAGVIGGRESGISENTKRIILEIANFHPILIRKAARAIATRTESAVRFEKNLPVAASTLAAARAVELLKQYADAKIVAFNDTYPVDLKTHENAYRPTVELTAAQLTRLMGVALPGKTIIELLSRLGCSVSEQRRTDGVIFDVSPPWFRQDLNIPE
ncbi:MAG TPA: phenylalanine--tRNA ligase subunit beta, partial [Patescibacteria group bacterium]|nr:phenylalanine--tRNA ligase subunit beta [Patescibacteria group bacterium]